MEIHLSPSVAFTSDSLTHHFLLFLFLLKKKTVGVSSQQKFLGLNVEASWWVCVCVCGVFRFSSCTRGFGFPSMIRAHVASTWPCCTVRPPSLTRRAGEGFSTPETQSWWSGTDGGWMIRRGATFTWEWVGRNAPCNYRGRLHPRSPRYRLLPAVKNNAQDLGAARDERKGYLRRRWMASVTVRLWNLTTPYFSQVENCNQNGLISIFSFQTSPVLCRNKKKKN